jgi:ketosteroid isomerase-like protein
MRHRMLLVAPVGILVAAFAACQPGAGGLGDQDKAAIRKVADDAVKMVGAGKTDWIPGYVDLYYAEDAKFLMPGAPAVEGRQAIKAAFASLPITSMKFEILDIEGRGDLAYVRGAYDLTLAPPGATAPVVDKGKYVEIWKKQVDGSWKAIRDIFNSDLPPTGITIMAGVPKPDASPEIKRLASLIGSWKGEEEFKASPMGPGGKGAFTMDCQWFSGGFQVICRSEGTTPAGPMQGLAVYGYDAEAKTYTVYGMDNTGFGGLGKGSVQGKTWTYSFDFKVGGKPMKARSTVVEVSPAEVTLKEEFSAGGPWALLGEGKATKVK